MSDSMDTLLTFPAGLVGFPELKTFRIFEPADGYPLKFLQSVDNAEISFVCIDPAGLKPDYAVPLSEEDAQALAIEQPADALVLTLVVIPEDPRRMPTTLSGPLLCNVRTPCGRQFGLNADQFPLQYPILGS